MKDLNPLSPTVLTWRANTVLSSFFLICIAVMVAANIPVKVVITVLLSFCKHTFGSWRTTDTHKTASHVVHYTFLHLTFTFCLLVLLNTFDLLLEDSGQLVFKLVLQTQHRLESNIQGLLSLLQLGYLSLHQLQLFNTPLQLTLPGEGGEGRIEQST